MLEDEQARKVKESAIPEWAQGLYYNKGLFSEALLYHDDEAIYFEVRGKDNGVVRFSFEMLETLTEVIEEGHVKARGQQVQEQTVQSARDFFGESLGKIKAQLQSDRAELEDLAEQLPEGEVQAQLQEMIDSYSEVEGTLDLASQDLGVEDAVNRPFSRYGRPSAR
jgi:hypothetical protein